MATDGYINLNRKLSDHWLWTDKPFTKGQAWVDLLFMANFADSEMLVKGVLVKVHRGEVFRSHEYLRERWGWKTTKKVRSFLTLLENEKMVTTEGTAQGTRITIENYSVYQSGGQAKEPAEVKNEGNQKATKGQPKGNKRKKKKEEKEEKEIYTPDLTEFSPLLQQVINEWLTYKEERKEGYKPTGLKSWLGQVRNYAKDYDDKEIAKVIRSTMASQYKGVVWEWLKNAPKKTKVREFIPEEPKGETLSPEEQAKRTREMREKLGGMFK
jgi:hypothetical protein